jgi:hypothetical protein
LWDAAFERSRLALCQGFVELLEVSGHDIVRACEDCQRGHANLGEVLRTRVDGLGGCPLPAGLPPFGIWQNNGWNAGRSGRG